MQFDDIFICHLNKYKPQYNYIHELFNITRLLEVQVRVLRTRNELREQ